MKLIIMPETIQLLTERGKMDELVAKYPNSKQGGKYYILIE